MCPQGRNESPLWLPERREVPGTCRQALPGLARQAARLSSPKSSPYQRRSETRRRQGSSVQLPDEPMRCLANAILAQAHETAAAII